MCRGFPPWGWLYARTGSLVPGIIVHIVNNLTSTLYVVFMGDNSRTSDLVSDTSVGMALCLLSAVMLLPVLYLLTQTLRDSRPLAVDRE